MPNGTKFADRLLDILRIKDHSDLLLLDEICWARHLLVTVEKLEGSEARLVTNSSRGKGIITVSSDIYDNRRKRFSIAHELGHFEMHRSLQGILFCTSDDIREGDPRARNILEQEANEFASAFLLPARFISPLYKKRNPSLELIIEIADRFTTSLTATALRYLQLCDEPVAIVYSRDRHIQWFQESSEFRKIREDLNFFFDVHARVDSDSLANKLFEDPSYTIRNKNVQASVWFTPGMYRSDAFIFESSYPMPKYNAVLTLIWIDEEIDEGVYDF